MSRYKVKPHEDVVDITNISKTISTEQAAVCNVFQQSFPSGIFV